MKQLFVLRHGKSNWDANYNTDFDRPLAPRGIKAASKMAEFIEANSLEPELIISSPANRAISTAQIVSEHLGGIEIQPEPTIYGASSHELSRIVMSLSPDLAQVLLVGHNPGLEGLVEILSDCTYCELKTCSLAVLESESGEWAGFSNARLVGIYHPREIQPE